MEESIHANVIGILDGKYLLVEFQDHLGNVCYFHTDGRVVWIDDKRLYDILNAEVTDEQISSILNNQGGTTV